jgi:hypothetical protein
MHHVVGQRGHGVLFQFRNLGLVCLVSVQEELLLHEPPHLLCVDRLVLQRTTRCCVTRQPPAQEHAASKSEADGIRAG